MEDRDGRLVGRGYGTIKGFTVGSGFVQMGVKRAPSQHHVFDRLMMVVL